MGELLVLNNDHTKLSIGMKLLNQAVESSFRFPNSLTENLQLAESAEILLKEDGFIFLSQAVRESIIKNFMNTRPTERDIQDWFKLNYSRFFGDKATLVNKKNHPKHIPDAWLYISGENIPVEMKLHNFDVRSLDQLQRYMNFYSCRKGIAVAKKLTCELPVNITFIPYIESETFGGAQ